MAKETNDDNGGGVAEKVAIVGGLVSTHVIGWSLHYRRRTRSNTQVKRERGKKKKKRGNECVKYSVFSQIKTLNSVRIKQYVF